MSERANGEGDGGEELNDRRRRGGNGSQPQRTGNRELAGTELIGVSFGMYMHVVSQVTSFTDSVVVVIA